MNAVPVPSVDPLACEAWLVSVDVRRVSQSILPGSVTIPDGSGRLLFDGFLLNRDELAASLGLDPAGSTAQKVVAAAVARWGYDAFARLRGNFAVVLTDVARETVVTARDHVGHHPLFYTLTGHMLCLGTSPRDIVRQPGVSAALNRLALADALCRRFPYHEESFYEAVRRVPCGHYLECRAGRLTLSRYWDPLPTERPIDWASEDEVQQFDVTFERAVNRALSVGRSGVLLSGGLDSGSITAAAVAVGRSPRPVALSLGFTAPECDERAIQRNVAAGLRLEQRVLLFDEALAGKSVLPEALSMNQFLPAPIRNLWSPAYAALVRVGRALGIDTVLTGDGGDEWTSAPARHAAELLRRGRVLEAWRFQQLWARSEDARGLIRSQGLRPLASMAGHRLHAHWWDARRARRMFESDPVWLVPDPELRTLQRDRCRSALGDADPIHGFVALEKRMPFESAATAMDWEEFDAVGRHLGVTYVHPFFDVDLVTLLARTPVRLLNAGGRLKGLLRQYVGSKLPAVEFERQRKVLATGFFQRTLAGGVGLLPKRVLELPTLAESGLVDVARVNVDQMLKGNVTRLVDLVNVETWMQAHRV